MENLRGACHAFVGACHAFQGSLSRFPGEPVTPPGEPVTLTLFLASNSTDLHFPPIARAHGPTFPYLSLLGEGR